MDWQQEERESLLFVDPDFSWSEPPPKRRRITQSGRPRSRAAAEEPISAGRRVAVIDPEPDHADEQPAASRYEPYSAIAHEPRTADDRESHWDQPTAVHSHFDEMMAEWSTSYGPDRDFDVSAQRSFDLSDPGVGGAASGQRRTVLITGHGDERYLPAPRARRGSQLRFHERDGFSPDRFGLWAVLLAIALVVVAAAH
jgi:hypothetical protein